jgi:transposase
MLQLTPQSRIFLAVQPVDFRKGIDSLVALCRQVLYDNPLGGTVYVFRNRTGTTLKLLMYDGQGFWLCTKRLSNGHFAWWPTATTPSVILCTLPESVFDFRLIASFC